MTHPIFYTSSTALPEDYEQSGGKGKHLFLLQSYGFRVPHFVVIPAETLRGADADQMSVIATAVERHLEQVCGKASRWAVRSSAVSEDGREHSFAGQFDTFLHVPSADLAEKIAEVCASAYSARVLAYRQERGLPDEAAMAVVVQQMMEPEVAGVAFGAHPVSGDRREKVINAVYGLGEGLVSGLLNADTYTLRGDQQISAKIVRKTEKVVFDSSRGAGTHTVQVPRPLQDVAALAEGQIRELAEVLDRLEQHLGHPQDVEFGWSEGLLFLLQTRPVTTPLLDQPLLEGDETFCIWDNSNIVESYPGHTSPLTFSFIIKMYEAVYRQLMGLMGLTATEVESNREVLANMLGLLEGRVYYNLLNWYKALAALPGYALNAEFMEKMMGVKERFELKGLPVRSRWRERLRLLNLVSAMGKNWWSLPRMRKDFERDFEAVMQTYGRINFQEKTAETLMALYLEYEQTLLKKWKAPLVNDFFAMIYFGVLQKLMSRYQLDSTGTLHNDLLCGARDVVSTEPIRRCLELSATILDDPATRNLFLEESPEKLLERYQNGALPENIQRQITEYLARWGNRCVGELKLETITWTMNPVAFLRIIQSYVHQGTRPTDAAIDLEIRAKAEQTVRQKLSENPVKRLIFNYVLRETRRLVSARENLRYARTRGYGVVRDIFNALGLRLHEAGALDAPRDIFHLTQGEIFDFIKGTSVNGDLRDLISLRKKQYAAWAAAPPPAERFDTTGMVYVGNDFRKSRLPVAAAGGDTLTGIGCCAGKMTARVRVVRSPEEVPHLEGDILVTMSTDPGWVTLFPTASAILVEKGSLLSHSAIVSREMGKPCIVGITGLLDRLQTGDVVEMDGSTGQISIKTTRTPTNEHT